MFSVEQLSGVLVALVTPMTQDRAVDEPAVGQLVEHVLAGGVQGLLPLGSTGETASLDEKARRTLLACVVRASARRVPVICGVAQSHLAAARAEVDAASNLGADAALVAPPFYYPTDQEGVLAFYRELARHAPRPLMLYNIPQFTKVVADPETVATLAREGTIKGIKDSSRDFEYFEAVCLATGAVAGFRIFTGSDTMLLACLAMGESGTICGAGNVAPAWVVRIYEEFQRGDLEAVALDFPSVLTVATENATRCRLSDRYSLLPGNALEVDLGTGFDVVLVPNLLHSLDRATNELPRKAAWSWSNSRQMKTGSRHGCRLCLL
jgi:4-hydroxy-tetrahydrodipicolinate synthase